MKITQESWAMVEREIPHWPNIFYTKMFSDPGVAKLFKFSDGDFINNPTFQAHTQKVKDTLHTAMGSLDAFDKLGPVLKVKHSCMSYLHWNWFPLLYYSFMSILFAFISL